MTMRRYTLTIRRDTFDAVITSPPRKASRFSNAKKRAAAIRAARQPKAETGNTYDTFLSQIRVTQPEFDRRKNTPTQ